MRMTKVLLAIPFLLVFSACTKSSMPIGCAVEDAAVTVVSGAIVTGLQCSNGTQVAADIKAFADKANLCPQSNMPQLNPLLCQVLVKVVMNAVTKPIPATWGCSASNAGDMLDGVMTAACRAIGSK